MSNPEHIAESIEDPDLNVVIPDGVIEAFLADMETEYGPNWRSMLGVVSEAKRPDPKAAGKGRKPKKRASEKSVTSQKQLSLFRMLAKGPKSPSNPKGHSPRAWARIQARLPKGSNLHGDAGVQIARRVLKNPRPDELPTYSGTRFADYKRRRRARAASAPQTEAAINMYIPVDDDFATRLDKALGE
jgi:hypothetical protein